MSREILFKAKRNDNDKWVEGFYFCMVHDDGRHVHHFIMPLGADLSLGTPIEKIQVEVDPETVCQYTGLTDKNGKKIWENDVVEDRSVFLKGIVFYWKYEGRYAVNDIYNGKQLFTGESWEDVEVIGNIFDNPKLLEVAE